MPKGAKELIDVVTKGHGWVDWQFLDSFSSRHVEKAGIHRGGWRRRRYVCAGLRSCRCHTAGAACRNTHGTGHRGGFVRLARP